MQDFANVTPTLTIINAMTGKLITGCNLITALSLHNVIFKGYYDEYLLFQSYSVVASSSSSSLRTSSTTHAVRQKDKTFTDLPSQHLIKQHAEGPPVHRFPIRLVCNNLKRKDFGQERRHRRRGAGGGRNSRQHYKCQLGLTLAARVI